MTWQQNVVLQTTFGQDGKPSEPQEDTTADSSILRYIKTLTDHQMNAKQQRMDRYLQQVKHAQSGEDLSIRLSKPPQHPSATGSQRQQLHKKSKSKAKSRRNDQEQAAAPTTNSRSRLKRSHDKIQENRQLKKLKQTQQITTIGSLDRFRLHGAWSQKSASQREDPGNTTPQDVTALTGNKPDKSVQIRGSTRMPQTASSGSSTMSTSLERRPVQELKPLPVEAHTAPVPTQDQSSNLIQPTSFLSPEEAQPRNVGYVHPQQEVFIPTYDPLISIMESIYF